MNYGKTPLFSHGTKIFCMYLRTARFTRTWERSRCAQRIPKGFRQVSVSDENQLGMSLCSQADPPFLTNCKACMTELHTFKFGQAGLKNHFLGARRSKTCFTHCKRWAVRWAKPVTFPSFKKALEMASWIGSRYRFAVTLNWHAGDVPLKFLKLSFKMTQANFQTMTSSVWKKRCVVFIVHGSLEGRLSIRKHREQDFLKFTGSDSCQCHRCKELGGEIHGGIKDPLIPIGD